MTCITVGERPEEAGAGKKVLKRAKEIISILARKKWMNVQEKIWLGFRRVRIHRLTLKE